MLYHSITIDGTEYKCKLNMKALVALEKSMGCGIYDWLSKLSQYDMQHGQLPPASDVILIFHEAIKYSVPEMTLDEAYELFDKYIEEGHIYIDFFNDIAEIINVSGLVPKEEPKKKKSEAKN